ncbi:helix-turn-helix transcriptional regulator [Metabacillus iocasae]|uniref:DNA-binding transcriptional regulator YafY n=1 Tax=Priestia iocasae TaxID=2291674 RepID=A0ABS2QSH1_9BACI|nr:WYL domain-containing protein [Metabacillus iocasae]MBM7702248.1 putative DNA-binding transcriptional regulator YafY [Metabacillus iocasae]
MKDIVGKQRLLKIKEILEAETDEQNELSIKDIKEKLKHHFGSDYEVDARAIKRDLQALIESEFDIIENKGKYGENFYSHQARLFELYELRLLVDAVLSAKFITQKESEQLIEKIKQLTSQTQAKSLPSPVYFDKAVKSQHAYIKIDIDRIHTAISTKKIIGFQYGRYNVDKEFQLGRNGDEYVVYPYALIWHNDFYYLIGEFKAENQFRHYRVDRMRNVRVIEESFKKKDIHLSEYVNHSFQMFAGEEEWLKVHFTYSLLNVVIDRFGIEADIRKVDDTYFELRTKAKMSKGLIGWLLTWGSEAKVISPEHVVEEVKEEIRRMQKVYE